MERQPTPVFLLGESPWRSLAGYSPWGRKNQTQLSHYTTTTTTKLSSPLESKYLWSALCPQHPTLYWATNKWWGLSKDLGSLNGQDLFPNSLSRVLPLPPPPPQLLAHRTASKMVLPTLWLGDRVAFIYTCIPSVPTQVG